jgi:hypothetical protein
VAIEQRSMSVALQLHRNVMLDKKRANESMVGWKD